MYCSLICHYCVGRHNISFIRTQFHMCGYYLWYPRTQCNFIPFRIEFWCIRLCVCFVHVVWYCIYAFIIWFFSRLLFSHFCFLYMSECIWHQKHLFLWGRLSFHLLSLKIHIYGYIGFMYVRTYVIFVSEIWCRFYFVSVKQIVIRTQILVLTQKSEYQLYAYEYIIHYDLCDCIILNKEKSFQRYMKTKHQ